jgi:putative hydrolase of the HAD superfamily
VTFAPPAVDAIFLDVGNTLVSMDFALLCDVLATHGVSCTPEMLARAEAATRPALSRFLAAPARAGWHDTFTFYIDGMLARLGGVAAGTRDVLAPRLAVEIRAKIPTQRLWSAVLPGVPEALAQLRAAGLTVVAVSNSDGTVEQGLETFGLRQYLHHVVDSAVVGAEKPDVAIFHHALALAGAAPERTLHVGDLYAVDVLGARAAGLHALLLDPHGDWTDVDCDVVADVPALAAAIVG